MNFTFAQHKNQTQQHTHNLTQTRHFKYPIHKNAKESVENSTGLKNSYVTRKGRIFPRLKLVLFVFQQTHTHSNIRISGKSGLTERIFCLQEVSCVCAPVPFIRFEQIRAQRVQKESEPSMYTYTEAHNKQCTHRRFIFS